MHTHTRTLNISIKNKNSTRYVHIMNAFENKCQKKISELKREEVRGYKEV